jgi:hypothetical protein
VVDADLVIYTRIFMRFIDGLLDMQFSHSIFLFSSLVFLLLFCHINQYYFYLLLFFSLFLFCYINLSTFCSKFFVCLMIAKFVWNKSCKKY